mgnify:CR=1 FL=1
MTNYTLKWLRSDGGVEYYPAFGIRTVPSENVALTYRVSDISVPLVRGDADKCGLDHPHVERGAPLDKCDKVVTLTNNGENRWRSSGRPPNQAQPRSEATMSESCWKRSMLSLGSSTPAVRQTNVSSRCGSTQYSALPAP